MPELTREISPDIADSDAVLCHITLYKNSKTTQPVVSSALPIEQLIPRLLKLSIQIQKDTYAWGFHRLAEGTTRASRNVECVTAYVVDVDDGTPLAEMQERLAGLSCVFISTHSHTPEKPKYRVVVFLSVPVPTADWAAFRTAADAKYSGGHNDRATGDPARLYYVHSCPPESVANAFSIVKNGALLDPVPLIAAGKSMLASVTNSRSAAGAVKPTGINGDVLDEREPDPVRALSALQAIDPSGYDRRTWLGVVWAAKAEGVAYSDVLSWCESHQGYIEGSLDNAWSSDKGASGGFGATVSGGTLYAKAFASGWRDLPVADAGNVPTVGQSQRTGICTGSGSDSVASPSVSAAHSVRETLNDAGNAARISRAADGKLMYCASTKVWYIWDGGHWQRDTDGGVTRFAMSVMHDIHKEARRAGAVDEMKLLYTHAARSLNEANISAAISLYKSFIGVSVSAPALDGDLMLIGVKNGVIDLSTGKLREAKRTDLVTKIIDIPYNETATCPTWGAFIDSIFCGDCDLADYVQRAIGYTLTGMNSEQVYFFLYGKGANGKSVLLRVMFEVLGVYASQVQPEVLMSKPTGGATPEIAGLVGCRAVFANEISEGSRLSESLVKSVTGGDAITARTLYGAPFTYTPQFKLWMAGNHKPIIRGDDHGIWRRTVLIPFEHTFTGDERDEHLLDKLRAEYEGILRWMVEGCLIWQKHGLNPPKIITQQVNAYRSDMDTLQHWIDEVCDVTPTGLMRANAAYTSYQNWCRENGHGLISAMRFAQKLSDRGYKKVKDRAGTLYIGLTFKQSNL
ncbi:phage/plasmid primase, P4 family [Undibacterium griseum]|uniref:PriCT-2 domain-containing protein n=1 Tax=Undibacterium griseum TaxID=2762295 RepID=A0ABR6YRD9_9BURK|nr:phage/plasmid primase, P4 family [Undibacterium griseum]MBC3886318.1 PriCT-2 domain-containing protein [Undibacterium griseum]